MKLQTIVITIGFLIFGGISAKAQQPTAKDLYFGYSARTERRQPTKPNSTGGQTRISGTGTKIRQQPTPIKKRPTGSTNAISPIPTGLPGTKVTIELSRKGKLSFVSPNYKFLSGDKIRLRLKTNFEGYVSILNLGTSGKVNLLYPVLDANGEYSDNYVTPTNDYQIPQGDGWIVFDNRKGTESITVIMSANPMEGLSNLDRNSAYFKKSTIGKDLFVQTVGADLYAVCAEAILDETVGFTLKLRHS